MKTRLSKTFTSKLLTAIAGIIVLFFSNFALADSITIFGSDAVDQHTDLSISYLSQLFGTVGNVLHGVSGQMMGMLFYKFNAAVLVVAGLWLSYTVFTLVLKAAHAGSFMGQQQNHLLVFVRIALGFAMLFPSPATGYSIFQDIVAKVVVYSVKLADETWDQALDYLLNGGTLYHAPQAAGAGNILGSISDANGQLKQFESISRSQVCMDVNNNLRAQQGNAPMGSQSYMTDSAKGILFPGPGNTVGQSLSPTASTPADGQPACGYIKWSSGGTVTNATFDNAMNEMLADLSPIASQIANFYTPVSKTSGSGNSVQDLTNNVNDQLANMYVDYTQLLLPIANVENNHDTQENLDFISEAKASGWVTAGLYYWDILHADAQQKQATGSEIATVFTQTISTIQTPFVQPSSEAADNFIQQTLSTDDNNGAIYGVISVSANTNANSAGNAVLGSGGTNSMGLFSGIEAKILTGGALSGANDLFDNFNKLNTVNPIQWLFNIGNDCLRVANYLFTSFGIVAAALAAATALCQGGVNLWPIAQSILGVFKPFVMGCVVLFFVAGAILTFYVPLYPYLLFTLGVVGWLIAVIEAMVAAPLVMLGLTHPEGHDFLGKAEQALILLLGVFVRPVLMLFGLLGGFILTDVGVSLVGYGFRIALGAIFYNSAIGNMSLTGAISNAVNGAGGDYGLFTLPVEAVLMVIFAMLVYMVINKSFSLIYVLPNNVLQWIGGFQRQDDTAAMAEQIKGTTVGASQQMGSALGQTLPGGGSNQKKDEKKKGEGDAGNNRPHTS